MLAGRTDTCLSPKVSIFHSVAAKAEKYLSLFQSLILEVPWSKSYRIATGSCGWFRSCTHCVDGIVC